MRLFVSVDLPESLADAVAAVQEPLSSAAGIRLTDPTQAHVTLVFLGDVDPDRVPDLERELEAAVDDAEIDPFEARFAGLGVFPSLEYIRVVWLGVEDGHEELTRLQAAVENRTTAMGFEADNHEFTPHATIARMDHAGGKERVQSVVRERSPTVGTTTVEEIRLTESRLTDDGPVYETRERFPLE
ncbi:RNA 2',3'-cyclic phosphodiesterase [Natronosalvus caseinilyticus]|uniref:RNA 2',3'-cyclic phosphodiesterase n=1 Tax=Natronosalvus caseinilyticus TaxID=2953747 RepID=UPI0028AF9040|nr:RNA 2',3'-cyclic phosphodiesterase [Natronosalvus caseinilyticus]